MRERSDLGLGGEKEVRGEGGKDMKEERASI